MQRGDDAVVARIALFIIAGRRRRSVAQRPGGKQLARGDLGGELQASGPVPEALAPLREFRASRRERREDPSGLDVYRRLSSNWKDRSKADAFVAVAVTQYESDNRSLSPIDFENGVPGSAESFLLW